MPERGAATALRQRRRRIPDLRLRSGYAEDYGAMVVDATANRITFRFANRGGRIVDGYRLAK
ncbi:MAG: hypothetical protein ACREXM_01080 [Gammaproteobacteria bacterium]